MFRKFNFLLFTFFIAAYSGYGVTQSSYYIYPYINQPSFSNYSTLGLIQNPNSRFHEAGSLAFVWSSNKPYLRGSIVAYPFDWFEAAYHYTDINNAYYSNSTAFSGRQTYKDKGFDIKLRILKESFNYPQVAIGIRDLAGTNTFGAEFITFSKFFGNTDITFGLGWGDLSANDINNPLGDLADRFNYRDELNDTQGGEFNFDRYFSGNMGTFGGIETTLPNLNGLRVKVEYDGTDYKQEGFPFGRESFKFAYKPVRQSQSRFNFGLVYPVNKFFKIRASFNKGNNFSIGFSVAANFGKEGAIVRKQDRFKEIRNQKIIKSATAESDTILYRASLVELRKKSFFLQAASKKDNELHIAYAQPKYINTGRAIGRVVRTLDSVVPDEITKFRLTQTNAGLGLNEISIDRTNFLRYQEENLSVLAKKSIGMQSSKYVKDEFDYKPDGGYPATFWKIAPVIRSQIGGPDGFYFGELSLGYSSETKFSSNINLITSGQVGLINNFDGLKLESDSVLPHVRSDIVQYLKKSKDYNIKRFQFNIFGNPHKDLYSKISFGILEDMFLGVGGELLYRPFFKNYGIGAELWSVQQRDFNMMLGVRDYKTVTGHINLYYQEPLSRIIFTIRGGKFLAKDSGINFDFSRKFSSGLRIGAFFAVTDISKEEFGEGSFDKGFYFHIPMEAFYNGFSKGYSGFGLRPLTRDGAALINHGHHLWGITEEAQRLNIEKYLMDIYD